jgi:TetR/AcrR family transcriptional regulator, mexJK operon transcriptional repressor
MKDDRQKPLPAVGRPKDAAKRAEILRAATDLFLKDGYELTSMEAVARKADVSKLTIYSHFADKAELFSNVIRIRCERVAPADSFREVMNKPMRTAFIEIATRFVTNIFTPDSIHLHRILQAEATRHPEMARVFYETGPKRVRAAFGELLQQYVNDRRLVIRDIPKAAEQFFSLLKGETLTKLLLALEKYPSPSELKKHAGASVDMFLAAFEPRKVR